MVRNEIFEPLGMTDTSLTAEAIEAAPNTPMGHRWTPEGTVEVPFTPLFPYGFGGAGAINSTVEDMARWVRLQLGDGTFEGKRIVSAENLAVTRIAAGRRCSDTVAYAMGWVRAVDAERRDRLAQRRHHRLRRLRRHCCPTGTSASSC